MGTLSKLSDRHGFSLLELIVVLVLVALISAVVVMRWSGVQHRSITASAIDKLTFLDQHMRTFARNHRTPCGLSFKLDENRIRKLYHAKDNANPAWETLGRGVRVEELRTSGKRQHKKRDEVIYGPNGTSPTYAVHLACPGERQVWLVFAGITGQVTQFETERDADAALAITSAAARF